MADLKPVQFRVPGEPQGKGRPRIGKVGQHSRMFTPQKTVAYEGLIAMLAQNAMQGREVITRPVMLEMLMEHPIRPSWSKKKQAKALAGEILPTVKCDADNCIKAVCDALNGVVWRDDVQVVKLFLTKKFSAVPGVTVRVVPLEKLAA
ncbi:RusA family crossover junction endodeoxyribonuclease [Pseudomonas putida]|nr:RusA family crossover junction endodeoxyribonuclease [Pseudomonas putida]